MESEESVTLTLDPLVPKASRVYDFFLDGTHHFEADRLAGQQAIDMAPFIPNLIRLQHHCLKDVAAELTRRGFDIILDFASGLPTQHHLHHFVPPGTQVVYSDIDPETVAHAHHILGDTPNTLYVQGDIRNLDTVFNNPDVQTLLQGRRDVAFVTWGIALFLNNQEIQSLANTLYTWSAPHSCWAFNVPLAGVNPHHPAMARFLDAYDQMGEPVYARAVDECKALIHPWVFGSGRCVSLMEWHRMSPASFPPEDIDAVGEGGGSYGGYLVKA